MVWSGRTEVYLRGASKTGGSLLAADALIDTLARADRVA